MVKEGDWPIYMPRKGKIRVRGSLGDRFGWGKKPTVEQEFHGDRRRRKLLYGVAAMLRASESGGVGLGCLRATCGGGGGAKQGQGRLPAVRKWRRRRQCAETVGWRWKMSLEELFVKIEKFKGLSVNQNLTLI